MAVSDYVALYVKLLGNAGILATDEEAAQALAFANKHSEISVVRKANERLVKALNSIRVPEITDAQRSEVREAWYDFQQLIVSAKQRRNVPAGSPPARSKRSVASWLLAIVFISSIAFALGVYLGLHANNPSTAAVEMKLAEQKAAFDKERSGWDASCLAAQRKVADDTTAKCTKEWHKTLARNRPARPTK